MLVFSKRSTQINVWELMTGDSTGAFDDSVYMYFRTGLAQRIPTPGNNKKKI